MPEQKPLVDPWPYSGGSFMTPDVVWSIYLNERRRNALLELELAKCGERIHNQRIEIKRLQIEVQLGATP